jgi:hypothetical protein
MCVKARTHYVHGLARGMASEAIGTMKNLYLSLQFLKMWLQYCLITLLTSETLCPQKTKTNWCGLDCSLPL